MSTVEDLEGHPVDFWAGPVEFDDRLGTDRYMLPAFLDTPRYNASGRVPLAQRKVE